MRHPVIKAVGYSLVVLVYVGALATAIAAAMSGRMFLGYSARGIPVWTATTLALFALIGLAGVMWLGRRLRTYLTRRTETSD
ncbi:hypothetical protein [Phenylobacterium conjunctum]|jgi:hypothetical protein|uniref:Uncharacterized protein n=1 Tax=Phenylobacterium conjunctum TaxID=1298959 RepID=A0ABW3T4L3_9CAUL